MTKTKHEKEGKITQAGLERFKKYLIFQEKSSATVEKYVRDVGALMRYARGRAITRELLLNYKQYLIDEEYATRSINSMIASINSYFEFMEWHDMKIKQLKLQRQIYCPEEKELTRDEYERLIKAAEKKRNERLKLIIQTICGTGIRVSELKFITAEAARTGEAVVSCKSKTRTVFIVKELKKKLLRYCAENMIKSGPVFTTRAGRPVDRVTVWRDMKALCKEAGVDPKKVFPHNLRHLFARTFYGIDKDIAKLADVLGHSSINTTRIYIVSSGREHRRKMELMHLII